MINTYKIYKMISTLNLSFGDDLIFLQYFSGLN